LHAHTHGLCVLQNLFRTTFIHLLDNLRVRIPGLKLANVSDLDISGSTTATIRTVARGEINFRRL
jgi:hypothetical protein